MKICSYLAVCCFFAISFVGCGEVEPPVVEDLREAIRIDLQRQAQETKAQKGFNIYRLELVEIESGDIVLYDGDRTIFVETVGHEEPIYTSFVKVYRRIVDEDSSRERGSKGHYYLIYRNDAWTVLPVKQAKKPMSDAEIALLDGVLSEANARLSMAYAQYTLSKRNSPASIADLETEDFLGHDLRNVVIGDVIVNYVQNGGQVKITATTTLGKTRSQVIAWPGNE